MVTSGGGSAPTTVPSGDRLVKTPRKSRRLAGQQGSNLHGTQKPIVGSCPVAREAPRAKGHI